MVAGGRRLGPNTIFHAMDFELSDEQRAFQETARAFAREEWLPHAPGGTSARNFRSRRCGGRRHSVLPAFMSARNSAAAGSAGSMRRSSSKSWPRPVLDRRLSLDPQHGVVDDRSLRHARAARAVFARADEHGAPLQLLPDRAGQRFGCGGSRHPRGARRRPITCSNGTKAFISGGGVSDIYVTMVRTGAKGQRASPASSSKRARPACPSASRKKSSAGTRQPTAMVIFEDCRVPVANRLGAEGDGFKIAMMGLDGGRLNIAACSLGGARACLEAARDHLLERRQFGRPLAEFQALQFKLADMATELDAARLMVRRGAASLDRGDPQADDALRDGQAPCDRCRVPHLQRGVAAVRRLRLPEGFSDRALSARRARPPDPRRHQRDHAGDHRPPSARLE